MFNKNNCPSILYDFLNYLAVIKGYSFNTIKAYKGDLIQFFYFIKIYKQIDFPVYKFNIFVLLQVREADIIAFLVHLNFNKEDSAYTRQRKVAARKSFYKWLFSLNPVIKRKNPTDEIPFIHKYERLPKYLSLQQAKQIQEIFTNENCNFPERNNAIISLFLSSGLRISELVNIDLRDVNFENSTIVIFGKNSQERIVYFNNYCKEKILDYFNLRKTSDGIEALFINRWGNRISVNGIENICKKAYHLMGIDDLEYTTHTLRHTAATIIYKYVNEDVLVLKEFLGHSSLASTQIYTHVDNKKLKDAANNHPLSNCKVA